MSDGTTGRIRPGLTRESIARAALDIVETRGYSGASVRAVAAQLGVVPSALYKHIKDRDELVDLVLEQVLADFDTALDPALPWRERAATLARRLRATLHPRPGLAAVFKGRDPLGENSHRTADAFARCILDAGLRGSTAGQAWYALVHYVIGFEATFAADTGNLDRAFDAAQLSTIRETLDHLDAATYPALVALGSYIWEPDLDARFEYGLQLILMGIEHDAEAGPADRGAGDRDHSLTAR